MATVSIAKLVAYLSLDTKGMKTGVSAAEKSITKLATTAVRTGTVLAATVTAPIIAAAVAAVKASNHYEELEARFDLAFEGMAGSVRDWSKDVADATNQSANQLQEFASGFGGVLRSFNVGAKDAAELSKALVSTGLALSDLHDADPSAVMAALEKSIRGSARALGEYKIIVDKDEISQQLLNAGITGGAAAASKAQIAMATLAQVLKETEAARRGADFGSTIDLLTGLKNVAIDVGVAFGDVLRPQLDALLTELLESARAIRDMSNESKQLAIDIAKVAAVTGPLLVLLGGLVITFGGLGTVVIVSATAMAGFAVAASDSDGALRDLVSTLPLVGSAIEDMVTRARINWLSLKKIVLETNEQILDFETGKGVGGPVGFALRAFAGAAGAKGTFGVKADPAAALEKTREALIKTRAELIKEENRFSGKQLELSMGGAPPPEFKLPGVADQQARLEALIKNLPLGSEFTRRLEERTAKALKTKDDKAAQKEMQELASGLSQIDAAFLRLDEVIERGKLGEFGAGVAGARREVELITFSLDGTAEEIKALGDEAERRFRKGQMFVGLREVEGIVEDLQRDAANFDLSPAEREVAEFNERIAEIQEATGVAGPALERLRDQGVAALREMQEKARQVTIDVGRTVAGAFRGTIAGVLSGDREFDILEQFKDTGIGVIEEMFAQWIEKKLLFDQEWTLNFGKLGEGLKEFARAAVTNLGEAFTSIGKFVKDMAVEGITALKDLIVWIYKAITSQTTLNALRAVGSAVTGVLGFVGLQGGGKVKARPGGTPYILGEGGEDEWVIPDSKMKHVMGSVARGSGGGSNVEVNVYSSQPAEVRRGRNARGGQTIDVYIDDVVSRGFVRGSQSSAALDQTRGLKRIAVDR